MPFGNAVKNSYKPQNPAEIASIPLGDTVLPGTDVIDDNEIRKVPILFYPHYIWQQWTDGRYYEFMIGIMTGMIPMPLAELTDQSISHKGVSQGYTGPGMLTLAGDKLIVKPPDTFIWGFKTPYTIAVKKEDGIEIRENNRTVKIVSENDFSNGTIPLQDKTLEEFKEWYNSSENGEEIGLIYTVSNFSDGRNPVKPEQINQFFGSDVLNYMNIHPPGSPIMVHNMARTEEVIASASTGMDYYEDMDNAAREENARAFVAAWNNTIIPPHTMAYGSTNVYYVSVYDPDPNATVKWASHGTCPPARALRDAVLAAGFPLPSGMTMEYRDVISNYADLITGIRIYNTGNYPVRIEMWTEGEGGGMPIYAQIIELRP